MSPFEEYDHRINAIAEDLTTGDRRKAIYLCGSLVTDSSVTCVRETLRVKVNFHPDPPLFIMSILRQLGRYDILKRVYKVDRNEIEKKIQTYKQVLPRFRVLMVTISDNLQTEDVEQIKFLLGRTLSLEKKENVKTFLEVMIELEKLDLVSPETVELVEDCLRNIGRLDLARTVAAYKMSGATSEHSLPPQHSGQAAVSKILKKGHNLYKSQPDQYNLRADQRGVCVIIDCVGNDGGMLENTFKALHFNVLYHTMLGADEIFETLKEVSKHRQSCKEDAFVCCIISRSFDDNILGTDSHGRGLSAKNIRDLFLGDTCPVMVGKPKLFFIQSYVVPESEHLEQDGCDGLAMRENPPTEADVLWSHCWTDESQLLQEQHHSVYLKALTDALSKAKRKTDLLDVQMKVNGAIYDHNQKHPEANYRCDVKHTLRKNLYLE
ncbi:PREDICTED: CASP8 and FADD-like apoptosis regulator isoform X2 [Poecilia mexicana]|uniref:CASP8 and FADD-like apoptosis regulator isoform X2 n=1 Tax=Poecilia mexicana TaxID=48701 RepID=UPI00072E54D2|nr:PREDICTED: CASP8 and FADD-like apoptosis regulator isoform X2 [Poecilia mexicana]